MSELLTVELPVDLARQVRAFAEAANRPLKDVILDWISQGAVEPAIESLPEDSIVALCDASLDEAAQEQLSQLLASAREGELDEGDRTNHEQLMALYRQGLKLKARAWKEAVARGLRPPLTDDAA
jgi:hypothetical protein